MERLSLQCHKKLMELGWRVIRKSRENLADMGFAWNQYIVMKNIYPGESLTLSEISERVARKNSNVTPIIDFLEERGIVRRIPDEQDRRVVRVELTKEGVKIRQDIISHHEGFIQEIYRGLNKEELERFIEIIDVFLEKVA